MESAFGEVGYSRLAMEPLFRQVVIGMVPQPRQLPPPPFSPDDLQRAYFDVSKEHPYQQFQFLPGDAGAQFLNSPDDGIVVQPGLIQVRHVVASTPEVARERCGAIVRLLAKRLGLSVFLATGIKVVAHVPALMPARSFIADRLMQNADHLDELGPDFFAGGVKYRSLASAGQPEETLLIEPFIHDDNFLYVDYDVQRPQPFELRDQISTWLDEAFGFVRGPAMRLLDTEG